MPNTSSFITTPEYNRLTRISFEARINEAAKILASKSQVDNALNIADKNREKIEKLHRFDLRYFDGKMHFDNDHKII